MNLHEHLNECRVRSSTARACCKTSLLKILCRAANKVCQGDACQDVYQLSSIRPSVSAVIVLYELCSLRRSARSAMLGHEYRRFSLSTPANHCASYPQQSQRCNSCRVMSVIARSVQHPTAHLGLSRLLFHGSGYSPHIDRVKNTCKCSVTESVCRILAKVVHMRTAATLGHGKSWQLRWF